MHGPLFIVAAGLLDGDVDERTTALARLLGLAPVEARMRVQPPAPRVLASFSERAAAERLAARLTSSGFAPLLLSGDECEQPDARVPIHSFQRIPDGWQFETRDGWQRLVDDASLRLVLKVSSTTTLTRTDTSTVRRFSLGKAVLTGGLSLTTKKTIETASTSVSTRASMLLVADGQPTFVFHESDLQFQGLGSALQPTRQANWQRFAADLCARTPRVDDRLANRGGQVHLLGGVLAPERYLDVGIAVLRRALLGA